jgi:SAM-dependent methyltransferase
MHSSHLFYTYYDTLFSAKNYAGEIEKVFQLCSSYHLQPLENILEIGCGTGNHTLELARINDIHVTAVDVDSKMLALAQTKADKVHNRNISFISDRSTAKNVDLCVALFNVVNYICVDDGLSNFFTNIAESLRLQGVFIFDCWNGTAALLDPPGSKAYEQYCDGQKVCCYLTSQTDVIKKITILNYQLDLFNQAGNKIESGNHQIEHRLWTPEQIKSALRESGFKVKTVCIPFKFDLAATETDWKIMFVCRKL